MNTFISHNEKETLSFGKKLGQSLKGGEIIALSGDLGAGKTKLSQGIALGLGVKKKLNSPTFVIVKKYPGHKTLIHIDAYRLNGADDLINIGWEDFINPETVILIEWPERIKKILPVKTVWITIKSLGENSRKIITKEQKARLQK